MSLQLFDTIPGCLFIRLPFLGQVCLTKDIMSEPVEYWWSGWSELKRTGEVA